MGVGVGSCVVGVAVAVTVTDVVGCAVLVGGGVLVGVGVAVSEEGFSVGVCVGSGVGLSGTTTLGGTDTDGTETDGTGTEIDGTDTEIDGIVGSPERVGVGRVMPSPTAAGEQEDGQPGCRDQPQPRGPGARSGAVAHHEDLPSVARC